MLGTVPSRRRRRLRSSYLDFSEETMFVVGVNGKDAVAPRHCENQNRLPTEDVKLLRAENSAFLSDKLDG